MDLLLRMLSRNELNHDTFDEVLRNTDRLGRVKSGKPLDKSGQRFSSRGACKSQATYCKCGQVFSIEFVYTICMNGMLEDAQLSQTLTLISYAQRGC